MEVLISHSFDYLSSSSPQKIRKGLRQVEGLLAQICLSRASPANKRHSMIPLGQATSAPSKKLVDLEDDPAFREFFKLQQSFQSNIALRLISCLERLMGKGSNGQNDLLIISTLDLLQGVLLLHPPSRELFAREIHMNLLLDLLDPSNCPAIQSSTLLALVSTLLGHPANTRIFESLDGLLVITSLFKSRPTAREVKMKLVEFLYFYLMPEAPQVQPQASASSSNTAVLGGRGRELVAAFERSRKDTVGGLENTGGDLTKTKNTEDKQKMLGKYLCNVDDLVEDLRESGGPFTSGAS